jgi:hypothetical protein
MVNVKNNEAPPAQVDSTLTFIFCTFRFHVRGYLETAGNAPPVSTFGGIYFKQTRPRRVFVVSPSHNSSRQRNQAAPLFFTTARPVVSSRAAPWKIPRG